MDKYNDEFDSNFEKSAYLNSRIRPTYDCANPSMYEVFMLGGDNSPVEFISFVATEIFHKINLNIEEVQKNMELGKERFFCGVYTKDVAETKIKIITDLAFKNEYSLKCIMRKGRKHVI